MREELFVEISRICRSEIEKRAQETMEAVANILWRSIPFLHLARFNKIKGGNSFWSNYICARKAEGTLDFTSFAARHGFEYADFVELYVRCLPHAKAIFCFAARQASPEEMEEARELELTTNELRALAEVYAARYGASLSEILL